MSPVVQALGHRAALSLSALVGGRQLWIPTMAQNYLARGGRARLIALVGVAHAENLITHFAGMRIYIPRGPSPHNTRANPIDPKIVARLTKRGLTASTIAERLGCTERTVYAKRTQAARNPRRTK